MSFLLIEHDRGPAPRVSTDTVAIRRVLAGLGGAWRLALLSVLVPPFVRDPLYRFVARHRYRWFGRHDSCRLPDPAQAGALSALMQGGGFLIAALPPWIVAVLHDVTGSFLAGWVLHLACVVVVMALYRQVSPDSYAMAMSASPDRGIALIRNT